MGESKHTPGPWHLVTRDGQPENGSIAVMSRSWQALYTRNALGDADADARLIAAAPLMLEALRGLLIDGFTADDLMLLYLMSGVTSAQQEKFRPSVERLRAAQNAARAAIKAATGGET